MSIGCWNICTKYACERNATVVRKIRRYRLIILDAMGKDQITRRWTENFSDVLIQQTTDVLEMPNDCESDGGDLRLAQSELARLASAIQRTACGKSIRIVMENLWICLNGDGNGLQLVNFVHSEFLMTGDQRNVPLIQLYPSCQFFPKNHLVCEFEANMEMD